ncbi:hypothetical protein ACLI4Z_17135 [Natrialbaceae archaeon A-arb3/5]
MSLAGSDAFGVTSLPIDDIDNGTSILLTGEDTDALKTVFARLVAAEEGERSIVLATNSEGRLVQRALNQANAGAGSRASVLACEGPDDDETIKRVDDLSDLTSLGMEFSSLVATSQQSTTRFRSGIFFCSTICQAVEDTRTVYRFLNTNFLTELRRGDGIGVCALDTSADVGADVDSMIAGMETSFTGRIHVEKTGANQGMLEVTGLSATDETIETAL